MREIANRWLRNYREINFALADQVMVSGMNFVVGVLLARLLGPREFGVYTLSWMAVLFVNTLQTAMIISPMRSIGPQQVGQEEASYYGAVFAQQIAFALLAALAVLLCAMASGAFFPQWHVQPIALPLACATLAFQMQDFMRRYFFNKDKPLVAFKNDVLNGIGQLGLLVLTFKLAKLDAATVLWVSAAASTFAVGMGLASFGRISWDRAVFRKVTARHWHYGKWLAVSAPMQWASANIYSVAVGGFLGPTAVGSMKAAQNLMAVAHILFLGLGNIAPQQAARRYQQGQAKALGAYVHKMSWFCAGATLAIALVAAVAPEFWLNLLYGPSYREYGFVVQWFAVAYVIASVGLPLVSGLGALEQTRPIFWACLAMTACAIAVGYPLIQHFGLIGALAGSVLNQILFCGILLAAFMHRIRTLSA